MDGTEIGQYRLLRRIGEGTMGTVFLAVHQRLNRHVALKVLKGEHLTDDAVASRFADEASITSGLRHPNIVEVLDAGTHEGTPFIVMELLEGESLSSRLSRERLSMATVLEFAYQATQALEYAHRRGVIHRDLKPDNLYIVADPRIPGHSLIKVLDFSIAKLRESAAERLGDEASGSSDGAPLTAVASSWPMASGRNETRVGSVFGTPPYMSPEQCRGSKAVDARTDVYALGVILYEMLTGQVPFESEDVSRVLERHVTERPLDVRALAPDVPGEVAAIVDKALAKSPAERHQSMAEFGAALTSLSFLPGLERSSVPNDRWSQPNATTLTGIGTPPTGVAPGTLSDGPPARSRTTRVTAVLSGLMVCAAGVAYFTSTAGSGQTPGEPSPKPAVDTSPTGAVDVPANRTIGASVGENPRIAVDRGALLPGPGSTPATPSGDADPAPAPTTLAVDVAAKRGPAPRPSKSNLRPSPSASNVSPLGAESPAPREQSASSAGSPSPTLGGSIPTHREDEQDPPKGKLTFDSAPWSNVYLNGRLLGTTPLIGVVLPVGKHTLELRSPETQRKTTYVVEIKANQNVSRFVGWETE